MDVDRQIGKQKCVHFIIYLGDRQRWISLLFLSPLINPYTIENEWSLYENLIEMFSDVEIQQEVLQSEWHATFRGSCGWSSTYSPWARTILYNKLRCQQINRHWLQQSGDRTIKWYVYVYREIGRTWCHREGKGRIEKKLVKPTKPLDSSLFVVITQYIWFVGVVPSNLRYLYVSCMKEARYYMLNRHPNYPFRFIVFVRYSFQSGVLFLCGKMKCRGSVYLTF